MRKSRAEKGGGSLGSGNRESRRDPHRGEHLGEAIGRGPVHGEEVLSNEGADVEDGLVGG